jgi:dihydroorotase
MLDTLVTNGTLVSPVGRVPADLGIGGGRIVGQYRPGEGPAAARTVDAAGLLVLPGIVDAHFHCRAPGHPEREDFSTGTLAAAAGGATIFRVHEVAEHVAALQVFQTIRSGE